MRKAAALNLNLEHLDKTTRKLPSGNTQERWRVRLNGRAVYLSAKPTPGTAAFLDAYHKAIASLAGSGTTVRDYALKVTPRPDEAKALEFVKAVWGAIEIAEL